MKRSAAPETFTVSCPITSHICGYAGKTALLPPRSTAPSAATFDLPNGRQCHIAQRTSYPFDGEIEFSFGLKERTDIPFLLRIPAWCRDAKIYVNGKLWRDACPAGTFVTLRRKFKNGDRIRLCLGMQPVMNTVPGQGIYVQRGPLLFSYPVPQRKQPTGRSMRI